MTIEWSFQNLTDGKKNQYRQRLTLGSSPTYKCPYVQGLGLETRTTAEDNSPDQESFNWKGRNLVLLTQQKEKSGLEFDSTSDHTKCQTLLGQGGWEVSLPPSIQLKFPILETIFYPENFKYSSWSLYHQALDSLFLCMSITGKIKQYRTQV